jgi:uncharacterized SAM-binding protein YcdF (DUF218 family)
MLELKKILSVFVTIPGSFIIILIASGIYGIKKKNFLLCINLIIGLLLYCISISYFANPILGLIEKDSIYKGKPSVDVIILLGGGTSEGVSDLSGISAPISDMTVRIVDAVRLYNKYSLPIIITGGSASEAAKDAVVAKRFLIDLGVKPSDIIIEDQSMDTVENALYVKKLFKAKKFKKGLLVTSGYHLKRAEFIFRQTGIDVYPHSCGLLSEKKARRTMYDFLPSVFELKKSGLAFKEAIGLLFYRIKYVFT